MNRSFPVFFISFDELNAEKNWLSLKSKYPAATRIHGVSGIFEAHKLCAEQCEDSHFFVVDADNIIEQGFRFGISDENFHPEAIHVWRCRNAVNDLIYGYGAIKLFPKHAVLLTDKGLDLSTGLNAPYKIIHELASSTHFNSDAFRAWRSGFREAVKLGRQLLSGSHSDEALTRLNIWCSKGEDRPFGSWCIEGARAGRLYAERQSGKPDLLNKINDFHWLHRTFVEKFSADEPFSKA